MIRLHRTLGIGLGMTALSLCLVFTPAWAQDVATTQPAQDKKAQNADEVEHLQRAAAQDNEKQAAEDSDTPTCNMPACDMPDCDMPTCDKPDCDMPACDTTDRDAEMASCKMNAKPKDQASPKTSNTSKDQKKKKPDPTAKLREESKMLSAEADLRAKKLAAELADVREESTRLKMQMDIAKQRQANELLKMELEKQRLSAEASLAKAQRDQAQADMKAELEDINNVMQLRAAQNKRELFDLKSQIDRMSTKRQLDKALNTQKNAKLEDERDQLMLEIAVKSAAFQKQTVDNNIKTSKAQAKLMLAQNKLAFRSVTEKQKMELDGELAYRKNPFDKETQTLYISDRRIPLNGPIISGTADYICDRINFFNNESTEKPIFLVIDNCPGGSVMQGYRIVKAIEASNAPVHVVVKSFAASMAAVITTLADHSYAYPNAIILHHQMSAGAQGNMTDIQQQLDTFKEWERRLAQPVADKMGVSVEEFKQQMYKHRKTGDWDEFADGAVKLKWVNNIVNEIREEGTRKRPKGGPPTPWWYGFLSQDDKGNTYCKLPPLEPMDAYMMYNPNHFYRMD